MSERRAACCGARARPADLWHGDGRRETRRERSSLSLTLARACVEPERCSPSEATAQPLSFSKVHTGLSSVKSSDGYVIQYTVTDGTGRPGAWSRLESTVYGNSKT